MSFATQGWVQNFVDLPESPSLPVRMNAIVDFWSNPCNAPWTVYVETLYPVAGRLALVLVDFDLLDLLRSCFRPDLGIGRGPRRKKGRRRGRLRGIPEPSNLICRMIPGTSKMHSAKVVGLNKYLWTVDTAAQRILFWYLIVDLTVDGFYWWGTLIQQEGYCMPTDLPSLYATDEDPNCNAFFGSWQLAGHYSKQWGDLPMDILRAGAILPEGKYEVTYAGTYEMTGTEGEGDFEIRIMTGGIQHGYTHAKLPQFQPQDVSVSAIIEGPTSFYAEQRMTNASVCSGKDGVLFVRPILDQAPANG